MVKEGQKGDYLPLATKSLSPLNKKEYRELIFLSLGERKYLLHFNVNKANSRRNMVLRKIDKIAL